MCKNKLQGAFILKNNNLRLIKLIISAFAVINLIFLFFFHYGMETVPSTSVKNDIPRLGTSLSLPSRFPAVTDLDLPNLGAKLSAAGSLKAIAADGTDITDKITCEAELDKHDERIALATFSVQGESDKKPVTITVKLPVTLNRPVLVLSSDTAELEKGEAFIPLNYVREAVDASGMSIIDNITLIGNVNTSRHGTYKVTFQAKDANGYVSDPKTLTVTVN